MGRQGPTNAGKNTRTRPLPNDVIYFPLWAEWHRREPSTTGNTFSGYTSAVTERIFNGSLGAKKRFIYNYERDFKIDSTGPSCNWKYIELFKLHPPFLMLFYSLRLLISKTKYCIAIWNLFFLAFERTCHLYLWLYNSRHHCNCNQIICYQTASACNLKLIFPINHSVRLRLSSSIAVLEIYDYIRVCRQDI